MLFDFFLGNICLLGGSPILTNTLMNLYLESFGSMGKWWLSASCRDVHGNTRAAPFRGALFAGGKTMDPPEVEDSFSRGG